MLLYELFKVVNRRVALLAVFFSLVGAPSKEPLCSVISRP